MGCSEPKEKYPKPRRNNPYNLPGGFPDYEFAPGDQVVPVHDAMDFIAGRIDKRELITHLLVIVDYNFNRMGLETREWIVDDPMKFISTGKHYRSSYAGHQLAPVVDEKGVDLFSAWREWQLAFFGKVCEPIFRHNGRPR